MSIVLSSVPSGLRLKRVAAGLLAIFILALFGVAPAIASDPIASAVSVRPQADGLLEGKSVVLAADMPLYEGQKISTGTQGEVQVVFADNTHMVVGPGSSLLIERYLMTGSGTASQFAISALGGTFRFITGNSKKTAYKIDTPTGTIGVRGTEFDFTVNKKTRKTTVVLFEGLVLLCGKTGQCASMSQSCGVAEMGSGQQAQIVGDDKIKGLSAGFPYARSQQMLRADFKVKVPRNCLQPTTITGSIAPPKPGERPSSPPPVLSGGGSGGSGGGGGGDSGGGGGRGYHNGDGHSDKGKGKP
jgi:hypothetical protein